MTDTSIARRDAPAGRLPVEHLAPLDFAALLERVQSEQPDAADLKAFWAALQADPALHDSLSDLAAQARGLVAEHAYPSAVTQAIVRHGIESTIRSLADPEATPLEQLLADNVGICWARLYLVEEAYTLGAQAERSIAQADYQERNLGHAHARFLHAVESLARVRRLLRPHAAPLQVNIAQPGSQQLNAQLPPASPALLSEAVNTSASRPMTPDLPLAEPERRGAVAAPAPSAPEAVAHPKRFHKGRFALPG